MSSQDITNNCFLLQVNIEEIIPYNFNDDYYEDIMKELFETKEIEKVKFCKIVRIIANKLIDAKKHLSDILPAAIILSNKFQGLQGKNAIPHVSCMK